MDERRKNAMDDRHPQDEEKPISRRNLLGAVAAGVGISALAGCETVDDGPETGSRAQSLLGDIPHLDKLREIDKARFVDVVTNDDDRIVVYFQDSAAPGTFLRAKFLPRSSF